MLMKDYKTGIKIIDTQHWRLFNLIECLMHICNDENGSGRIAQKALWEFEDFLRVHFATEEEIMRIYKYPQYELHKKMHKEFWDNISRLRKDCENGKLILQKSMVTIIIEWINSHLKGEDEELGLYLKNAGLE